MLTHQEAEVLISARQDAPIDPMAERELQAHLAVCHDCRAFAVATERLTAGLKTLPTLPASPRVRREVLDRTRRGRGIMPVFGGFSLQPGQAFAALATVLIIGLIGWFAVTNLLLTDNDDPDPNRLAAVPTEQVQDEPSPTATVLPPSELPTGVPTEMPTTVPATETMVPTTVPTTATTAPTDAPVDLVSTAAPEPTQVPAVPTDVPTEIPAEPTVPPTAVPAEPTAVPTDVPTEIPVEPTTLPTDVPDESTSEPTSPVVLQLETPGGSSQLPSTPGTTAQPTDEPASEPTLESTAIPTDEPTSVPTDVPGMIEPIDGTVTTLEGDQTPAPFDLYPSGDATSEPPIFPDDSTEAPAPEATEQPIDDLATSTPTTTEEATAPSDETTIALTEVSQAYSGIDGDPSGVLGLTPWGRLEYVQVPDGASLTTWDGYTIARSDAQPAVINMCMNGTCDPGSEPPADEGWQGDSPLGVIEGNAYFLRHYGDRTDIMMALAQGPSLVDAQVIGSVGPLGEAPIVWEAGGALYVWYPSGEWLQVTQGSGSVSQRSYPQPSLVRFAPVSQPGPLIGYFANGELVIAPVDSPDAAMVRIPSSGQDFDISPAGDRIAVVEEGDIVIYDMSGNRVAVYDGGDMQPRTLIWLNDGIVFADASTGQLYQVVGATP